MKQPCDWIDFLGNFWLLKGRERAIYLYWGIKGMTFEETAKKLGLTRERIRQICVQMLRKLRDFLDPENLAAEIAEANFLFALGRAKHEARLKEEFHLEEQRRREWERAERRKLIFGNVSFPIGTPMEYIRSMLQGIVPSHMIP